jgi:hypothetical protein
VYRKNIEPVYTQSDTQQHVNIISLYKAMPDEYFLIWLFLEGA